MAPRHTPRKPRAGGDYGAVGQRGRKTGATLPDTGIRDEHGMEPIPSFSSPEKAPTQSNGIHHGDEDNTRTFTADDSMEMVESTFPEATDITRTSKNARASIPRSVSPKKGLMQGSPRKPTRRSIPPISSPAGELTNGTPSRIPDEPSVDASFEELQHKAPLARPKRGRKPVSLRRKDRKKGPFDLDNSDDESGQGDNETIDPSLLSMGQEQEVPSTEDALIEPDTTIQSLEGGEPLNLPEDDILEPDTTVGAMPPPTVKSRGGRKPKALAEDPDISSLAITPQQPKKRGRPGKKAQPRKQEEQEDVEESKLMEEKPPAKLRPVKAAKLTVTSRSMDEPAIRKRKAPPLTERDPNTKMKKPKIEIKQSFSRAGSAAPSFIQRSETPATDSGAITTRSGRNSIKPLASWRGEKVIFSQPSSRDSLPGILEVVRTDEIMPPPRKRVGNFRPGRRRGRQGTAQPLEEIDEEDSDLEPWEAETGIQRAQVMEWNDGANNYDETDIYVTDIAYAADAIEMRDIQGAEFKFAKTLTLPFFGSGMVHLPPAG
ncbi:uncharacterized protein KY384_000350 [Bacidia gigantensis]|uniref:uncharacterized protein n=1 Tax=Bacidia gigantensis TaxID=2732470 RepID=UPI001D03A34B|nr:uncharacterized protein KY384_000350 [Bacidia gigantensis]KAG8526357.1 hypothetical protein KY384_000350 [Bacidia gigantensis]